MLTFLIVPSLDPVEKMDSECFRVVPVVTVDEFTSDRSEERLGTGVDAPIGQEFVFGGDTFTYWFVRDGFLSSVF